MTEKLASKHVSFFDPALKATVEVRDFDNKPMTIRVRSHDSDLTREFEIDAAGNLVAASTIFVTQEPRRLRVIK